MLPLVRELNLAEASNARVQLFKVHRPCHESDHVPSPAFNMLCDGRCLEGLELRRQDEASLNRPGAARIPDPATTTAAADPLAVRPLNRALRPDKTAPGDAGLWARPRSGIGKSRLLRCESPRIPPDSHGHSRTVILHPDDPP